MMNKVSVLTGVVFFLTCLNLILLVGFIKANKGDVLPNSNPTMHHKSEDHIKKQFDFNQEQMVAFAESKENHKYEFKRLKKHLNEASLLYYLSESTSQKDSIFHQLRKYTDSIYLLNLRHFEEVKEMCNPNQKIHLKPFIENLINGRNRMPPPPNIK